MFNYDFYKTHPEDRKIMIHSLRMHRKLKTLFKNILFTDIPKENFFNNLTKETLCVLLNTKIKKNQGFSICTHIMKPLFEEIMSEFNHNRNAAYTEASTVCDRVAGLFFSTYVKKLVEKKMALAEGDFSFLEDDVESVGNMFGLHLGCCDHFVNNYIKLYALFEEENEAKNHTPLSVLEYSKILITTLNPGSIFDDPEEKGKKKEKQIQKNPTEGLTDIFTSDNSWQLYIIISQYIHSQLHSDVEKRDKFNVFLKKNNHLEIISTCETSTVFGYANEIIIYPNTENTGDIQDYHFKINDIKIISKEEVNIILKICNLLVIFLDEG